MTAFKSSKESPTVGPITYITRVSSKERPSKTPVPKYPFMHATGINDIEEVSENASLTSAGYAKCLQAHMEFRANNDPLIADEISIFAKQYEIQPKQFRGRSEFFEIKQCRDKVTGDLKGVKMFRKAELTPESV